MRENLMRMIILNIGYAILIAVQFVIIGISASIYSEWFFALITLVGSGAITLAIAQIIHTIFLSYLEAASDFRHLKTAHYIGWLLCLIGGLVGWIDISFPELMWSFISLFITGGLILCGIYLIPLIEKEKGFTPLGVSNKKDPALETLKQRLAKGEITKEEYLELKDLIEK